MSNATTTDRQLLTTEEAAARIGLRATTLETWRSTKRVNLPYKKVGRSVRYLVRDIDAFLDRNTHGND